MALASLEEAATRSVTAIVPPPRSLDTFERATPGCDVVCGLFALPDTFCLDFGSQARTCTVRGCWTPLMRGRKLISSCCQVRLTGEPAALSAGWKWIVWSSA